ncbi:uncharacterized protein LOC128559319 [Mercenaria mercenaria]|uniref:uncharacterized protein LOC128559319 n=1 Tax=Mercenaria mercenaria TaxID=6596 RepID=UPI00234EE157|nr:uncharacterized protein LOC128559319 [Mercenaria mercenaria]
MSSLTSVLESMPAKRSCLIIVKEEFSILENSLHLLEAKSSAAISKMKTLYTNKRPLDGVEPLIELLSLTLRAKTYLLMSPEEQLGNKLYKIVQAIFPTAYERHKMVAEDELRHNKWDTELSPQLLNMLIGYIRDEVIDYKQNYQSAFQKYFNITVEAAQEFYKLLMSDVAELLKQTKDINVLKINKLMLSLAYRLNQLDQDWMIYISPQMQTWRDLFLVEAQHWGAMLKRDVQKLITHTVSLDRYPVCELQWTGCLPASSRRNERQRTISKSLTPSINSAFTSPLSAASTPNFMPGLTPLHSHTTDQGHSRASEHRKPTEFPIETPTSHHFDSANSLLERRPSSDPVNISQSSLLSGSYLGDMARSLGHYDEDNLLSFAHLRHSSSLPNIPAREKYIEMMPTSSKENSHTKETKVKGSQRNHGFSRNNSNVSPEIAKVMSSGIEKCHNDESDDSGTLTDDSCSQEADFSFPPLQEVTSSPPVGGSTENAPVTMIPDIAGSSAVVRPVVQNTSTAAVPVKPVAKVPSAQGTSATVFKQVAKDISGKRDKQAKPAKLKINSSPSKVDKIQSVHSDKPVPYIHSVPSHGPIKTRASILRDSETHHVRTSAKHVEDSLTNSLVSNLSLAQPPKTNESVLTTLPISSSTVDVIIILQRLVGIGKVLCRTLAPSRPGYESDQSVQTSSREDDFPSPPVFTKSRQKLYDCFLSAIRGTVTVYADNMLCMDLCGTTQSMASRLAGPRMICCHLDANIGSEQNAGTLHRYGTEQIPGLQINHETDKSILVLTFFQMVDDEKPR